jgi:LysR family transcriptional regulator, hydrogen peroxide-inducible genes activator
MSSISLRQLRYFDAVARFGHFGRAADACAVTQPALSMQIQELEAQLGVTLIERNHKSLVLTPAGQAAAVKAALILRDVQDFIDQARHYDKQLCGKLNFGVIPTVAPYLLPPLLPLLKVSFPDLELHLRETQTALLISEVLEAKLDLVLIALPVEHQELESMVLFEDRFMLAVPLRYQESGRTIVPDALLREERLLLLEEGHCFREQALRYCSLQQAHALNTLGASSFATIMRMVANGFGITLLPEMAAQTEVHSQEVRLLRLAEPEPKRTLALAWRKSSPRQDDFKALGQLILASRP